MGRRIAAIAAGAGLTGTLLAYPPQGAQVLARQPYTVVENHSVVLAPGLEIRLGTPVAQLPEAFSREAYDGSSGTGIVQWRGPSGNPVLALASGGIVRAMSVAFEPAFQTKEGVGLGDPVKELRRTYGTRLRPSRPIGYRLGDDGASATYFDTSCTGVVNQIGLAMGAEGIHALGTLWQPADAGDACSSVY